MALRPYNDFPQTLKNYRRSPVANRTTVQRVCGCWPIDPMARALLRCAVQRVCACWLVPVSRYTIFRLMSRLFCFAMVTVMLRCPGSVVLTLLNGLYPTPMWRRIALQ